MSSSMEVGAGIKYPHITIEYCTQCKWMLKSSGAAYFAQELLSTFSSTPNDQSSASKDPLTPPSFLITTVSLIPSTGGIFLVTLYTTDNSSSINPPTQATVTSTIIWDRKRDGGFPEVKVLKRLVRDAIAPGKSLGHIDRDYAHRGSKPVEEVVGAVAVAVVVAESEAGERQEEEKKIGGIVQLREQGLQGENKEPGKTDGLCMDCL